MIAADAAGGDDHSLGMQREVTDHLARAAFSPLDIVRFEDRARDAIDGAVGNGQGIDAVAEPERQPAACLRFAGPPFERLDDARPGPPGHMEPGHRIAMAHRVVTAALRPADDGEEPKAHGAEPCPFFACRERHIGFRPAPRPEILVAVEARRPDPVLQGEVVTVLDAESALFPRIHQKQAAERPEGLAAEALFALLIDHDDALAGVGNLRRGNQARQARADHNYVRIACHRMIPPCSGE